MKLHSIGTPELHDTLEVYCHAINLHNLLTVESCLKCNDLYLAYHPFTVCTTMLFGKSEGALRSGGRLAVNTKLDVQPQSTWAHIFCVDTGQDMFKPAGHLYWRAACHSVVREK